jgi:O-antigen/teichoic acid export membrane protein
MSIKKNFLYSSVLTTSNYIFPALIFVYVSRVLGVSNIGICDFVDSIINYFVLFSMMGVGTIGIREIAKNQSNPEALNKSFSNLFLLNSISTLIIFIIFCFSVFFIPQLNQHKEMFYIGGGKILFNLFLIEWFYKGIEDFRYITIRSVIVRIVYLVVVLIFVRQKQDYLIYYSITVGVVIINALINWKYRFKFVKFKFHEIFFRPYLKSFLTIGAYGVLTSMYTSFNVAYLGFVADNKEVGYYTTAIKLYTILLSLFTAFTGVMLPRMSSLVSEGKFDEVKLLTQKSFDALFLICFPLIIISVVLAPQIIILIAGIGYEGAIFPMRIVMPLMLVIGIEQILIIQILTPLKKDKSVLINSIIGAIVGVSINILVVTSLKSVGSSIAIVISELSVLTSANYFVKRYTEIRIPYKKLLINISYSLPYLGICFFVKVVFKSNFAILTNSLILSLFYFFILQIKILKNALVIAVYNNIRNRLSF